MLQGSCLCGAVAYEIDGSLGPLRLCHCARCRKATGTAYAAVSQVPASAFRVTRGEASLKAYSTDEGVHRWFCGVCGSPIFARRDNSPDIVRLRVGTLDTPVEMVVAEHIFVGSKAGWDQIGDDAPQHQEWP